jgi:hypothetical protein
MKLNEIYRSRDIPSEKGYLNEVVMVIGILISGLLMVGPFVIDIIPYISTNADDAHKLWPLLTKGLAGAMAGIIALMITNMLNQLIQQRAIKRQMRSIKTDLFIEQDKLDNKLHNVATSILLGKASEAAGYVFARLERAISVRNTFVAYGIGEDEMLFSIYSKHTLEQLNDAMKEFLGSGRKWYDIFSEQVLYSKKLGISDASVKLKETYGDCYKMRCIREPFPIVNFIIIEYGHRMNEREVLFGWGHHKYDPEGYVFSSRNPEIIATFECYWRSLEEESSLAPTKLGGSPGPGDIAGYWFDVSTDGDGNALDIAVLNFGYRDCDACLNADLYEFKTSHRSWSTRKPAAPRLLRGSSSCVSR